MKYSRFACKLSSMIVLGESNINVFLLASLHANYLLFKAFYKHMRADVKLFPFAGTPFKGYTINCSYKINDCLVAKLCRSVNVNIAGMLFEDFLDLFVYILLSAFSRFNFYSQTFILTKSNFRLSIYLSCKHHRHIIIFRLELYIFCTGYSYNPKFFYSSIKCRRKASLQSLLKKNAIAIEFLNNSFGSMSLAEAGYIIATFVLIIRS